MKSLTILTWLILLTFLLNSNPSMAVGTVMNSSVALASNVFASVSSNSLSYCKPEVAAITTSLENRGNLAATGNLTTRLFDPNNLEVQNYSWQNISLNGGELKNFLMEHNVTDSDMAGIYTAKSNFTHDKKFSYAETNFRIKKGIGTLIASPSKVEKTMLPGDSVTETVYFWLLYPCEGTYVYLSTSPGNPGNWVNFSLNPVYLSPEQWNATEVNITISPEMNVTAGDYTGYVFASADGQAISVTVIVHVYVGGIFDITTSIPSTEKEICLGDDISATVDITKFAPSGTVDVNMTYQITDSNNTLVDQKNETVAINTTLRRTPSLHVPSSAEPGFYTFTSILKYKGATAQSSDMFQVKYCPTTTVPSLGGGYYPEEILVEGLSLNVSTHRITTFRGNRTGFVASVKAIGNQSVRSVRLAVEGIPADWVDVIPAISDIRPNYMQHYAVLIKIPEDAEEGIYPLKVKATDSLKSNEEMIILIVGKNIKSATELLFKDLESIRAAAEKTLSLYCLDIEGSKKIFSSAENVKEIGFSEYAQGNYQKAIDNYEYAISLYEKVISRAELLVELKLDETKLFMLHPFADEMRQNIKTLRKYAEEKRYENFCELVYRIQNFSSYSQVEATLIAVTAGVSVFLTVRAYKKKKWLEKIEILKKVKERLAEQK